jgi:hypothetical protein
MYCVNYDVNMVFTNVEEQSLLQKCSLHLSLQLQTRRNTPKNWNKYHIAGEGWMRLFMKRHSKELSIRKAEATSLFCSISYSKTNIVNFFNSLEDVHKGFELIPPAIIWNTDETRLTAV